MTARFDGFVILAGMRTGSNLLEENLNALDGVRSWGEVFNTTFVGYPGQASLFDIPLAERDVDPFPLLQRVLEQPGVLSGFRLFHDHDDRVLQAVLENPRIAKIVLTRNALDSFISRKIAQSTGQWRLTNVARRKDAVPDFDADAFAVHLHEVQTYLSRIARALQHGGQTAFYLSYDDLGDLAVINGLAAWLGVDARLEAPVSSLKRQNPAAAVEKVANPDAMRAAIAQMDPFAADHRLIAEPGRGGAVRSYVAAARTPLLYLPIRSGPEEAVRRWLAALDAVEPDALPTGMRQPALRQWKAAHPGYRGFTVLRHPVARAHDAFCRRILMPGPQRMDRPRRVLARTHGLNLPAEAPQDDYDAQAHHAAFCTFLRFVAANLDGQTNLPVDAHWASQVEVVQGISGIAPPDVILREEEMATALPALAAQVGATAPPMPQPVPTIAPFALDEIYDDSVEALAQQAYARDYAAFGFPPWG